jgi:hypothetical protein
MRPGLLVSTGAALAAVTAVVVSGIDAPPERAEPRPAAPPVVDSGVQTRLDREGQAVRELGARLLGTSLKGRRVLLVTAPGVDAGTLATTTEVLTTAGARVSGTVALSAEYGARERANELENLAVSLVAPATTLPRTRTPTTVSAAVLARALVADRERTAGDVTDDAAALLAGLDDAGFATTTGSAHQGATLAVVIVGQRQSPEATQAAVDLAAALDARGAGAVLAGPEAAGGTGGALALVRTARPRAAPVARDPRARAATPTVAGLSTVDSADSSAGAVAVALALVEQVAGRAGDYGRADGASATLPVKR